MNAVDIFSDILNHEVQGIMMHGELADYFDFLDLMGFKRLHEYQFLSECACMRGIHRYVINHYEMLPHTSNVGSAKEYIPTAFRSYKRIDVSSDAKKNAIKNCMEVWCDWETETKKFYENYYCSLCDIHEIASALKVKEMISDVDEELKRAMRLHIKCKSLDYNLSDIFLMQDDLHDRYRKMEENIGVSIC